MKAMEPRPVPAFVDAMDAEPEEFDRFVERHSADKSAIAQISLDALCIMHEIDNPYELVSQPLPSMGPQAFMENSELFRFLPNFEELVLKAVQSNNNAANIFLAWFARHQFIQIEFYETVMDAAIETENRHVLDEDNLPENFERYEKNTREQIEDMKYAKKQIEAMQATKDFRKTLGIAMQYRIAAGLNQAGLLYALEKLIEHDETQLEIIKEYFAQKERNR